MHMPLGSIQEHAELPEVVAIEDLTAGALAAAAQEMAQEPPPTAA